MGVITCENCGGTKWLYVGTENWQCEDCDAIRPWTDKDTDEFQAALEEAYIEHKQKISKLN